MMITAINNKIHGILSCAQLQENEAFLYLGGGFTTESIPELELDETENKSKTLIACMEKILRK